MLKALKSLLKIGLILFFIVIFSAEARAEVAAPKIIQLIAPGPLSLTGTAPANSDILIYLDGNFIGQTEVKIMVKAEAGADCSALTVLGISCQPNWQFQYDYSAQKLADGTHFVMAIAKDKTSLVLSAPTPEVKFTINSVPAPTLIAPNEKTATSDLRPLIIGLAKDNTLVKIFIDDAFNGQTGLLKNNSGTANFAYRPVIDLNRGFHKIQAVAETDKGQASLKSEILSFRIELPLPAPTVLRPVVNRQTSLSRPFIVGLAKNDSQIKIYIDKKYHGELAVKNHPSGTANFAFKPKIALTRGGHLVYTVAIDKRGKKSIQSNLVNFSTKSSVIAESAQEARTEAVARIKEPKEPAKNKPEPVIISSSSGAAINRPKQTSSEPSKTSALSKPADQGPGDKLDAKQNVIKPILADQDKAATEKVQSLIGANTVSPQNDRGLVNEAAQNQGRLKLSIILFILFLVGVVAWLLWVNRELVKERRRQTEAEEQAKENKNNPPSGNQENKLL